MKNLVNSRFICILVLFTIFIMPGWTEDPQLGTPTLLQQALNLLPAVPVVGKNLKFEFGGNTWIAKVDGRNFMAGSMILQDTNEGNIITLNQTHIYASIPGIKDIGWVKTPGPEIVFDYKKGPPSSLRLLSLSMGGQNDSSSSAMVAFINIAVEEAVTNAILGFAFSSKTPAASDETGSFKVVTAKNVGLSDSDFDVKVNNYSTITITGYKGKATKLVIPNTLHGLTVTHIDKKAFAKKQLTSVVIPDSVIVIDQDAFSGNKNLKEVKISNSVVSIEKGAFENSNLEKVTLGTNLQIIRQGAFKGNKNLKEIIIPNSVVSIEKEAFENNNLEKVTLGTDLQIIGQYAFKGNKNLKTITISDSVTRIEEEAFANCGITKINLGNGLKVISAKAFMNNGLTEIILPESLLYVGSSSFMRNPVNTVVIPQSLTEYQKGSNSLGFAGAFVNVNSESEANKIITTITRITLPANVHQDNMKQFEQELKTFYKAMNNAAGTYIRNEPLPVPGSRPYWTRE